MDCGRAFDRGIGFTAARHRRSARVLQSTGKMPSTLQVHLRFDRLILGVRSRRGFLAWQIIVCPQGAKSLRPGPSVSMTLGPVRDGPQVFVPFVRYMTGREDGRVAVFRISSFRKASLEQVLGVDESPRLDGIGRRDFSNALHQLEWGPSDQVGSSSRRADWCPRRGRSVDAPNLPPQFQ